MNAVVSVYCESTPTAGCPSTTTTFGTLGRYRCCVCTSAIIDPSLSLLMTLRAAVKQNWKNDGCALLPTYIYIVYNNDAT